MEKELFDWKDWSRSDEAEFMFYEITLNRDIGPLKASRVYPYASLDYERGTLTIWDEKDNLVCKASLSLNISSICMGKGYEFYGPED